MSCLCFNCKSKKSADDVVDPTHADLIKVLNKINKINKKENRRNVKPIDELNITHNGIQNEKELDNTNFNCFSFFDGCYTNDDDIKRVHFNADYLVVSISQE